MIGSVLAGLLMQAESPRPSECVYRVVPVERRVAIGRMVMPRETADVAAATLAATDQCVGQYSWTTEQALHANGYAAMRMAAEAIAYELGHDSWANQGLAAVNALTGEQRAALAGTDTDRDNEVFRTVVAYMEGAGAGVAVVLLRTDNTESLRRFVLMVKFLALAGIQQDRLASP